MTVARLLDEAECEGRRAAEACRTDPSSVRAGELGAFSSHSRPAFLVLRRVLLFLHVPPRWLALVRALTHPGQLPRETGFLRRYAYWRGVRQAIADRDDWRRLTRGPVILMYHAIGDAAEAPSCYVVPRGRFHRQMIWLRLRRYRVISLSELVDAFRNNRLPPARAVVVTFDDGYADNHAVALPILRRLRIPATVFLVSGAVGGKVSWTSDPSLCGRPLLTADLVREMLAAGVEIGAHTRTHVSLTSLPAGRERHGEIAGAREDLERRFGRPVRVFAYPFGDHDPGVSEDVRRAGYEASCCSRSGVNDPGTPQFALRRVEVRGTDSLFRFARMVWSGRRGTGSAPTRSRGVATSVTGPAGSSVTGG